MMDCTIMFPERGISAKAESGTSLLDAIRAAGLPIEALCNGRGTCGKCRVSVGGEETLACKASVEDGMEVRILASAEGMEVLADAGGAGMGASAGADACGSVMGAGAVAARSGRAAIAMDIGTTTVVVKAIDPADGAALAVKGFANPQRAYGADVLSRINISMDDASLLSGVITEAVDAAVRDVLAQGGIDAGAVECVAVAGNTTMTYLLLGLPCRSLGLAPFAPAFEAAPSYAYEGIFHAPTLTCPVHIHPFLSAFVGGDIVSGLAYIDKRSPGGSYILVDMGTNGEIAYRSGERLLATSTAAGPALEGGNIACGMGGIPGAVWSVSMDADGGFALETIDGDPPIGICGSGVISLMAALLEAGYVESTGAFSDSIPQGMLCEVAQASGAGEARPIKAIRITGGALMDAGEGPADGSAGGGSADDAPDAGGGLVFTQRDVREFQLAKGAIRAGVDILIREMGGPPDVLYLAGGFGQKISLDSAFRVGLLPESLRGRVRFVGNSALGGCEDACRELAGAGGAAARGRLSGAVADADAGEDSAGSGGGAPVVAARAVADAEEINLAAHPAFNDTFMETMMF